MILFSSSCIFVSRWEVPIDGVMLDGQQLPASALLGSGSAISALIDTVITFPVYIRLHPDVDFYRRETV